MVTLLDASVCNMGAGGARLTRLSTVFRLYDDIVPKTAENFRE